MRGSFPIGRVRGIQIRVHFSFLLILPFLAVLFSRGIVNEARLAGVPPGALGGHPLLWGFGVAIALFLAVLIHEFAHALYAVSHGGKVRAITLLMIGGVSELTEPPRELKQEAVMALVGPVTSLVLGALFLVLYLMGTGFQSLNLRFALFYLAQLNLWLGLFNLLPAFPMDGGRILRAILSLRMGVVRGTRVAATLGKVFAALFAVVGLLSLNFILMFIAFFIYLGAEGESQQVMMKTVLGGIPVREMMAANPASVEASETVDQAAERMIAQRRLGFPVVESGQVLGVVTLADVSAVPPEQRAQVTIRGVTHPVAPATPDEDVWRAIRAMDAAGLPLLPVAEGGQLVGVLRREDVARGLQLHELDLSRHAQSRWPLGPRGEAHV